MIRFSIRYSLLSVVVMLFVINTSYSELIPKCVKSNNDLILALAEAASSTDDYLIKIEKGFYNAEFVYSSANLTDLTIIGGYTSDLGPCDTPDPDPHPGDTVLDGNTSHRGLGLVTTADYGPVNFTIDNLTIQNGVGPYAGGLYVKVEEVNVTLNNSEILLNEGGGVYIDTRGDVTLSGNLIAN